MSARVLTALLALTCTSACGPTVQTAQTEAPLPTEAGVVAAAPGGIEFPSKYKNWPVLSVTHRPDKETLRVVMGNLTAVRAARRGETNPWPNGTIIASTLWKQAPGEGASQSLTPGEFIRAEFMFKDVEAYASNDSGWGWARWTGEELTPYGSDESISEECRDCHKKVSGNDWLFMKPAILP